MNTGSSLPKTETDYPLANIGIADIILLNSLVIYAPIAQLDRASAYGAEG